MRFVKANAESMKKGETRFSVGQKVAAKFWEGRIVTRVGVIKGLVQQSEILVLFEGERNSVLVSRCGLVACLSEGGEK